MRVTLLLIVFSRMALAGFNFDYLITPFVGEPQRNIVPKGVKEFGITLPTKTYACMLRMEERMLNRQLTATVELWCCMEKSNRACMISTAHCTPDVDGAANLTLLEPLDKSKPMASPIPERDDGRRTSIHFYCLHDGGEVTPLPVPPSAKDEEKKREVSSAKKEPESSETPPTPAPQD